MAAEMENQQEDIMKPLSERTENELEDGMREGIKVLRAANAYEGSNPKYAEKARIAAVLVGAWLKARASEANRMQVEVVSKRLTQLGLDVEPKQLTVA
jgi:hypothetical protein